MQIQVDVDEMQNRLMEQKKVLSRQVQLEKKKVIPVGTVNQEGTEPVYDYAYRVHHMSLLERLENQLAKIDNALKRIEDGLYGICTNCGEAIMAERLEALPYAEFCINCQKGKE